MLEQFNCDVLVVGSGAAGLRTAIAAKVWASSAVGMKCGQISPKRNSESKSTLARKFSPPKLKSTSLLPVSFHFMGVYIR